MADPGEFFDPVASVYDARFASDDEHSPAADVEFYRELARDAAGGVLELGVGTGRIYLELLADGADVDGIDLSAEMLAELRERADERGLDPTVRAEDVRELDPDREYDLVYAPNRVFNHLSTLADQRRALRSIRRVLAPDGRFALDTFVPGFETVVEEYGEPQEETIAVDDETYRIVQTTTLEDPVEQVARLHRTVYRDDELVAERDTPFALVPKRQFELLFDAAGFDSWHAYGDFEREPLESAGQEMIWIVEA